MERTAERLELAAEFAEGVAEKADDELQALYLLNQRELTAAASKTTPCSGAQQSAEFQQAEKEGREMKTHYEASLQLHRLTGGGPKPEGQSGPVVTALNPNRHVHMVHGRPVMVLSGNGT